MGQAPLRNCAETTRCWDSTNEKNRLGGNITVSTAWNGTGRSFPEAIAANAAQFGQKIFGEDSLGTRRTYEELHARVCALSAGLLDLCLAKGDRIAVHSPNRLEVLEIYAACAQLGVICVPIWSELSVSDITLILRDTEPRLVTLRPNCAERWTSPGVSYRTT